MILMIRYFSCCNNSIDTNLNYTYKLAVSNSSWVMNISSRDQCLSSHAIHTIHTKHKLSIDASYDWRLYDHEYAVVCSSSAITISRQKSRSTVARGLISCMFDSSRMNVQQVKRGVNTDEEDEVVDRNLGWSSDHHWNQCLRGIERQNA